MKKVRRKIISSVLSTFFILNLLGPASGLASMKKDVPVTNVTDKKQEFTDKKQEFVEDELILKFKSSVKEVDQQNFNKRQGLKKVKKQKLTGSELVKVPTGKKVEDLVNQLKNNPDLLYVQPNYIYKANSVNDPMYEELWGLNNTGQYIGGLRTYKNGVADMDINAPEAWEITQGSPDIVVGVIDTGVDIDHPDLKDNIWTNPGEIPGDDIDNDKNGYVDDVHGWDFYGNDNTVYHGSDGDRHGTHVSGTIAGIADNNLGVVGVAPKVKIMPIQFLSPQGTGSTADAVDAINYAKMMGVKVTNNSWGGTFFDQELKSAIESFGGVFVAAAGNSSVNNDTSPHYPAAYDSSNIISVAAINNQGQLASFSNYGIASVDVGAPGVDTLSSVPAGKYEYFSGTSMATPHVTGTVALMLDANPNLTAEDTKEILINTVKPLDSLKGITVSGGTIDAAKAVRSINSVLTSDPLNKAVEIPVDKTIQITFKQDIQQGLKFNEISFKTGNDVVEANYRIAGNVLSIDPINNLDTDKTYQLYIPAGALNNLQGEAIRPSFTLGFTTIDTIPPTILETSPAEEEVNVPIDKAITVKFSENINPGETLSNITLRNGETVVPFEANISKNILTITPNDNLLYGVSYSLNIPAGAVKDLGGINSLLNSQTVNFTVTEDNIKPTLLATDPTNNATGFRVHNSITIDFDENIALGKNISNVVLKSDTVSIPINCSVDGSRLIINPAIDLQYLTKYNLSLPVGAVKDIYGNYYSNEINLQFTTVDKPPTVYITYPLELQKVAPSGSIVTFTAEANDDVAVSKVEFYVDNVFVGEDVEAPYTSEWKAVVGNHKLIAKAYDPSGNVGTSKEMPFSVPTAVTVTNPVDGTKLGGIVNKFNANFESPLSNAYLYIDGNQVDWVTLDRTDLTATIDYFWDTNQYPDGSTHTIEIGGPTRDGNIWSVGKSVVTIDNAIDITPPAISITSPANNSILGAAGETVDITVDAKDRVGVTKVEFYQNNVLVYTSTEAPYTYSWPSTVGKHTFMVKAYDAAGNVGTSSNVVVYVPTKVTVTNPADGSKVGGIIKNISATFNEPTNSPQLYINGVYAASGILNSTKTGAAFNFAWDTNQYADGSSVILEVTARTVTGSILSSGTSTVNIDNTADITPPAVNITSPANSSTLGSAGENVKITVDAQDRVGVSKVEFYQNNVLVYTSTEAPYEYNWPSTVGKHTFMVKAYDGAGNVGTSSNVIVYVPTKVTVTNPVNGSNVGGIIKNITASFNEPVNSPQLYINGIYAASGILNIAKTGATFNYVWDTNQYANGSSVKVEVIARTVSGNIESSGSSVITIDNTIDISPPAITITSPVNNDYVGPAGESVNITVDAKDKIGVTKVEFYQNNVLVYTGTEAPFTYNWPSTVGKHTFMVKAYDGAGNVGTSSNVVVYVPTKVTVTNPIDGSIVGGVYKNITASFNEPVNSPQLYLNGVYVAYGILNSAKTGATFNYAWDTNQYADGSSVSIEVIARTVTGSILSSGKSTITIDNSVDITPPAISITSPANNSTLGSAGETVDITVDAQDRQGVTKVEFYQNNVLVHTSTEAPYAYSWPSTVGKHTFMVKAYDAVGNVGTSSNVVVYVPTKVTVTIPADGSKVGGIIKNISATFNEPVNSPQLYINGVYAASGILNSIKNGATFNFAWDTNQYADGNSVTLEVTARTVTGSILSSGTSMVNIDNTVDITPPAVTITSPANSATLGSAGETVNITVDAQDRQGVTKVEFYQNNVLVYTSTEAPYVYNWPSTAGKHTFMVKAYDAAGNVGTSSNVIVFVPTKVTVTNPVDGSGVSGITTSISAVIKDPVNTAYLAIDGVQVAYRAPDSAGNVIFNYAWDTTTLANGSAHIIKIWAYTKTGNVLSEGISNVIVLN